METTRRDFLVGLFMLISVGVMIGALVLTSKVLERSVPIFMRISTGEGLTEDTPVLLQGLRIGRVTNINPILDSTTLSISFVAELRIRETFADGTNLFLPVGTEAIIEQPPAAIGQTEIRLQLPAFTPNRVVLQPGDTIASRRTQELLQAIQNVVDELREEVRLTLEDSRTLLAATTSTIGEAAAMMQETRPGIQQALSLLNANLERSEALIADIGPRVGPLYDSLTAALGDTRQLMATVQAIADTAQSMIIEMSDPIRISLSHMQRTAVVLENFAEQVSRRPTRLLTGVEPPARDTSGGNR